MVQVCEDNEPPSAFKKRKKIDEDQLKSLIHRVEVRYKYLDEAISS